MPQIGSEHGWLGGKEIHRLWWQWWLGNSPTGQLSYVSDIVVQPGNQIRCALTVDDANTVTFEWSCKDQVAGVSVTSRRPVMADTANWIVERASEVIPCTKDPPQHRIGDRHALPKLQNAPSGSTIVTMTDCLARLGPPDKPILRTPQDGTLIALRSIVPGTSRLFTELEPVLPMISNDTLYVRRYLP